MEVVMCIGMIVYAIVIFATGKFQVSGTRVATGLPAYLCGVILMLPLPFAVVFTFFLLMAAAMHGPPQVFLERHQELYGYGVLWGLIGSCLFLALLIANAKARDVAEVHEEKLRLEEEPRPRRHRRDEDDWPPGEGAPPRSEPPLVGPDDEAIRE